MSSTQGVSTKPVTAAPVEAAPDEATRGHDGARPPEAEAPEVDMASGYTGAGDPNLDMLALEVLARMGRTKASEVSIEQAHENKKKALNEVRKLEKEIEKAQEKAKKWGEIGTAFKVGAIVAGGVATVATAGTAAPVLAFAVGAAMKLTAMYGDKLGIKNGALKTGLDIGGSVVSGGAGLAASAASTGASTAAAQAAQAAQGACTVGQGGATVAQTQYQGDVQEGHADTTAQNNRAEDASQDVADGVDEIVAQRKDSGRSVRAQAEEAERAHESDARIIQIILGA